MYVLLRYYRSFADDWVAEGGCCVVMVCGGAVGWLLLYGGGVLVLLG